CRPTGVHGVGRPITSKRGEASMARYGRDFSTGRFTPRDDFGGYDFDYDQSSGRGGSWSARQGQGWNQQGTGWGETGRSMGYGGTGRSSWYSGSNQPSYGQQGQGYGSYGWSGSSYGDFGRGRQLGYDSSHFG